MIKYVNNKEQLVSLITYIKESCELLLACMNRSVEMREANLSSINDIVYKQADVVIRALSDIFPKLKDYCVLENNILNFLDWVNTNYVYSDNDRAKLSELVKLFNVNNKVPVSNYTIRDYLKRINLYSEVEVDCIYRLKLRD